MRPRIARRGVAAICCMILALAAAPLSAECWHPEAPRLVNYYLRNDIGDHLPLLAQWHMLVVPYYVLHQDPGSLATLRELNPQQRILAYIDPMCISQVVVGGPGDLHFDFHAGIDSLWIAYTAEEGDTIVFWPGTIHVNVTERCPVVDGERYRDYFVRFLDERLFPCVGDGTIDGIFLDEMSSGGYLWWDPLFEGSFDYDLDGVPDDPDSLAIWLTNTIAFLAESSAAARPPGSVLIGNNCKPFQPALNGKFFEAFPATWEGGLEGTLNTLDLWNANCPAPHVSGVNGIPSDPDNLRQFRYRFTGSLLADCYFSYDYSTSAHYQLDWFNLFDAELGRPAGDRYILGEEPEYLADFEAGLDTCVLEVPYVSEARVTDDPALVLEGEQSLHVWPINPAGWPALLELRLPDGWQAGEHYIFTFLYRVMTCPPEGSQMIVKAQMSASCPPVQTGSHALLPGAVGCFRGDLELGDCGDYAVYLRVQGDVSLVVDSLAVVAGDPGIWARDYEEGRVVCNTTNLPWLLPYDPSLILVDGDDQHQHYPGWQNGSSIYVWPSDGLVFLHCETVNPLFLNEILCRNESILPDEAGDHDPWLEIYNAGSLDAPLGGLQLALARAGARWCLPDTILPPCDHLLVWCDAEPQDGPLHADFVLPGDSGTVLLLDAAGAVLDSCHFPPQLPDTSWGRQPDGGPEWCFMPPTPGAANDSPTAAGTGDGGPRLLPCHPNPFNPATRLVFVTDRPGRARLEVLDVAGRCVARLIDQHLPAGDHAVDWRGVDDRGQRVASGLYVARLRCGGREHCTRLILLR